MTSDYVLGMGVHTTNYTDAVAAIIDWARLRQSRYVCAANVHMVMEAHDCEHFRSVVNSADLVTADGVPIVWALRALGHTGQARVYGPALMLETLRAAELAQLKVGFYGSQPAVLDRLLPEVKRRFPRLLITYAESPPFRRLTAEEVHCTIERINAAEVAILLVGLGCPKQERWMHAQKPQLAAVMLGVGAAFDFVAGTIPQAPRWMMNLGCEWLFRFATEPRRLWKRYLKHNPRFVVLFLWQLLCYRYTVLLGKRLYQ